MLVGSAVRECLSSGLWSGIETRCLGMDATVMASLFCFSLADKSKQSESAYLFLLSQTLKRVLHFKECVWLGFGYTLKTQSSVKPQRNVFSLSNYSYGYLSAD